MVKVKQKIDWRLMKPKKERSSPTTNQKERANVKLLVI